MKHLYCAFCDTLTKAKIVRLQKVRQGEEFNLQIKAEVCPNCKEEYYDGKTLNNFEEMVSKKLTEEDKAELDLLQ